MSAQDEGKPLEVASTYLLDFFSTGGRSVLIRGDPGTGKTSLVLQLLDYHSKNGFKSVYQSTRLSAKTLQSHQPWVEVVQGKYGTVPRLEERQIGFQDSRRMDGVRAIAGLRQYLEQVKNPFVVLDSWEGLFFESHTMGVEEISKLVEDYEARFVVVTERREQTDLDYLLDGVVVLRRKFHQGRIVREIELKKLRGVSIKQSRFLFTLESGKFRYLPPYAANGALNDQKVGEPIPTKKDLHSWGSSELDSILEGGLETGSLNLVEIENDVPGEVRDLILRTVLSNFVNTGHYVLFVPFVGVSEDRLSKMLPNLSGERLKQAISVLSYDGERQDDSNLKGEVSYDLALINRRLTELRAKSNKPVLVIMEQDALEGLYGADSISKELTEWVARLKTSKNIRIHLTSPNTKLLQELKAFSDSELRVEMIHGTPVLFAVKPQSELNAIIREPKAPGKLGLVSIV